MAQQIQIDYDPAKPLDNPKHEEFCFKYALVGNATEAYLQVYECTRDSANAAGSMLLANHSVRARVDFIHSLSTDMAFATLTRNLSATRPIVHDENAIITHVEDSGAQISAATAILKANGRISNGSAPISVDQSTNYTVMNMTQVTGIEQVADKIIEMNNKIMQRKGKAQNIIDAQITQGNGT